MNGDDVVVQGTSRVELEPVLVRADELGQEALAEEIVLELANRTWQGHNPYAEGA